MSNAGSFGTGGGGGGGVSSVSGTTNRITSTGGTTPIIDISAAYVGQTSLTTLGTITTGTWNGSTIDVSHGGTGDTSLTAYAILCGGTTSTGNVQSVSGVGTSGQILTSNGAGALPTWQAAPASGVTSVSGTTNRITSTGGTTPVIDISASYVGQSSITTLGTIATGVWNGTAVDLSHGGTNANLTASNGGIFYSTGTAGAILAGTATANQVLLSGSSTTPAWSTATYPSTATGTGTILRANGTNWVASTSTYPNTSAKGDIIYGSATNVLSNLTTPRQPGAYLTTAFDNEVVWFDPVQYWFVYDDLIGLNSQTSWRNQISAGTYRTTQSFDGFPGVNSYETDASSTAAMCYSKIDNDGICLYKVNNGRQYHEFFCKVNVLSDGTDTYILRVGLGDDRDGTTIAQGCWFQYTHSVNSGNFTINNANTTTTTANTSTAATTNWIRYGIEINAAGNSVKFTINGSEVANSPVTGDIPTDDFSPFFSLQKTVGTNERILYFDYYYGFGKLNTTR